MTTRCGKANSHLKAGYPWLSETLQAGFESKLSEPANHMWQLWKPARFENQVAS